MDGLFHVRPRFGGGGDIPEQVLFLHDPERLGLGLGLGIFIFEINFRAD